MSPVNNQLPPKTRWLGVYVEPQSIAGEEVWAVTTSAFGSNVRRRLFPDRIAAYAYAFERADWLELPLFDLAGVPAE